jgi:hypothetical protein
LRPFCLHYGSTLYEFHPWWCRQWC